ncbi:MAG: hypothetical protein JSU82_16310 [Rhodospirillales bacterium]|nr:MAG: hypothetical protein JSU82_16310 [Rhodospirillales bacterium]
MAVARLGLAVAVWAVFVLVAHELLHRFLFEVGPVPGPGLKVLATQASLVALATLLLLVALRPSHFLSLRAIIATLIWVALIVFGHYLSHLEVVEIRETLASLRESMGMGALVASAVTLAILLGLPFVPSVEMGLLMMTVFGRDGAVAAWLATISGLSLAYAAGRYMPVEWVGHWLARHGLTNTSAPTEQSALARFVRQTRLGTTRTGRLAAFLLRHRYLLFALLINMPGNSVLGGGGGIALISGFTRLYRWPWFVVTIALASLPIPLLVFLGLIQVDAWLGALGTGN